MLGPVAPFWSRTPNYALSLFNTLTRAVSGYFALTPDRTKIEIPVAAEFTGMRATRYKATVLTRPAEPANGPGASIPLVTITEPANGRHSDLWLVVHDF